MIKTYCGQPSYYIGNENVQVYTSILGGNVVATFQLEDKEINPFFVAPWWKEKWLDNGVDLLNVLRGNFFCLPIGGDAEGYSGRKIPVHGRCANENWEYSEYVEEPDGKKLKLIFHESENAFIKKEIMIKNTAPVIYEKNVVNGFNGKVPVGYHPTLKLPDEQGSAHLALGRCIDAFTTEQPVEDPAMGGYSMLKNNVRITDITKVPTIYGDHEDLTRQPICKGSEEVVIFISDKDQDFCYTAITNTMEKYVYFQLKNPKQLQSTMLWLSNGGRHYAPWNGRCTSVIGLEETTSFFHYGLKRSVEKNFIRDNGYDTTVPFNEAEQTTFSLIYGIAMTPEGFDGVRCIERSDEGIVIIGTNDQRIYVKLDLRYLK